MPLSLVYIKLKMVYQSVYLVEFKDDNQYKQIFITFKLHNV